MEGHRDERRTLVLAGRQEHVQLARVGLVGDRGGQGEELVGRVAHRRDDDDEIGAGAALAGDPPGDPPDPVGRADGRTAELLDDQRPPRLGVLLLGAARLGVAWLGVG